MPPKRNRTDRTLWTAGIIIAVIAIATIAIVRCLFSGLGGLKEGIKIARRECANEEEISRRATVVYLVKAQRQLSKARSNLTERPDELRGPNIALSLAEIELDHARSLARCVASDTTLPDQVRQLKREVGLARGDMAIRAKIAIKRLDRIHAEIDDLVQAVEPSDTTGQRIRNAGLGMSE